MGEASRNVLSFLTELREKFYERLGDFLYRLFVEAHNPFGAADVANEEEEPEEVQILAVHSEIFRERQVTETVF